MTELFVNYIAQTTLADAIDPVQTTLEIIPVAASPSVPQFRIRVDNEIMLVTAIAGATYTVVRGIEGTEKTAHDRVIVHYILTAAALGGQSDPAPTVPGLRSLGTGANQAAAGNDPRFTAASIPTAHAATHHSGGSDPLAVDASPATGSLRTLGSGSNQAAAGDDPRFSAPSPPTAHASTHHSGGSDPLAGQSLAGLLTSSIPTFAGLYLGGFLYPSVTNTYVIGHWDYRWAIGFFGQAVRVGAATENVLSSTSLDLHSTANVNWNGDTFLVRAGANTVAMRNGTNAQTLNLYRTYTDDSNFACIQVAGDLGVGEPIITIRGGGTGVGRSLLLSAATDYGGSGRVGVYRSHFSPSHFTNLYDLGASNAQWRTGYFGTSLMLAASAYIDWNGDTFLKRESAGTLAMQNGTAGQTIKVYGGVDNRQLQLIGNWADQGPLISARGAAVPAQPHLFLSGDDGIGGQGFVFILGSHLAPWNSNVQDIGHAGARHWRTGYFGTSVALASGANLNWNGDTFLVREAANTLAMRNAANAQTLRLFNTYTDGSTWERGNIGWDGNVFFISTTADGSAQLRPLMLLSGNALWLGTEGAVRWAMSVGNLYPQNDNISDIGAASNRLRSGYFGTSVRIGNAGTPLIVDQVSNNASIYNSASAPLYLGSYNSYQWVITSGALFPYTDNLFDIGSPTNRVYSGYFATAVYNSGFNEFIEMAEPAAGTANTARLFAKDNGSGKTQLCVRFNTGAVAILATEP